MKGVVFIIGCLLAVTIAAVLLVPTIIIGFEGGFKWQKVSSETSDNGQFQVTVQKRVSFPANEWIDPSVIVQAELMELPNREVLDLVRVFLSEDSDFSTPVIEWQPTTVYLKNFDQRKNQTITLKVKPELRSRLGSHSSPQIPCTSL